MPTRVDDYWKERVFSVKANNLSWGAGRIGRELDKVAKEQDRTGPPSERWVGDRLKDWEKLSASEQAEYREFHWPTSMQRGDLPWQAGTALKLLTLRLEHPEWRPSIRLARWYQYVEEAAPDLPISSPDSELPGGVDVAAILAHAEAQGTLPDDLQVAIEIYLAFAPWRPPQSNFGLYEAALNTLQVRRITIGNSKPEDIMVGPGFWL